jgi:hypothetical protein
MDTPTPPPRKISQRPIVIAVVVALVVVGLLASGIIWFVFQTLRESDASKTAQAFLREHPVVKEDLGEPIELDGLVMGSLSDGQTTGSAQLLLPLRGSQGSGVAGVTLEKRQGLWRVMTASYEGEDGARQNLVTEQEGAAEGAAAQGGDPSQSAAQSKLAHAYELYKSGKSQEALEELDTLLEQSPDDAEALYWRAQIRTKLGEEDAAREDILRAVALNVDLREAYQLHDYLLAKQRRWEEIIHAWTQHLERHPQDHAALLERAGARKHQGDRESALEDLKRACELGSAQACSIHQRETGG